MVESVDERRRRHSRPLRELTDDELMALTDLDEAVTPIARDDVRAALIRLGAFAHHELGYRDGPDPGDPVA